MTPLFQVVTTKDSLTANGMVTHSTSSSKCLDFFSTSGSLRNQPPEEIIKLFLGAFSEDPLTAIRLLFYSRDCRGGQGERRTFEILFNYLCSYYPQVAIKVLPFVPVYGRWSDLEQAVSSAVESSMLKLWAAAIKSGDRLACKWANRKGPMALKLTITLGLTPKAYRKMVVAGTQVVETPMCANKWDEINFSHVPSVAMKNYSKAFQHHAPNEWALYTAKLSSGASKVNSSVLFPHDIVSYSKMYSSDNSQKELMLAQWKALPDYISNDIGILPICDVSASMMCSAGGAKTTCLDISVALGLYCSEKNKSIFKDGFITFSGSPTLQYLKGDIFARYRSLAGADWQMNTNLTAVFDLILSKAVKAKLVPQDLPSMLLILSDMEFDQCANLTALEMIQQKYNIYGYKVPSVVFWNLNARAGNSPVKMNDKGVCLVSGYSPSILKYILNGDLAALTPTTVMMDVVNSDRYKDIVI